MNDREQARIAFRHYVGEQGESHARERWQVALLYPGVLVVASSYVAKGTALMWKHAIDKHLEAGRRTLTCTNLSNQEEESFHVGPLIKVTIHKAIELVTYPSFTNPLGLPDDCADIQNEIDAGYKAVVHGTLQPGDRFLFKVGVAATA